MNVTTVYELFSVIMQETFQHNNDFSITYKTNLCRFTQMQAGKVKYLYMIRNHICDCALHQKNDSYNMKISDPLKLCAIIDTNNQNIYFMDFDFNWGFVLTPDQRLPARSMLFSEILLLLYIGPMIRLHTEKHLLVFLKKQSKLNRAAFLIIKMHLQKLNQTLFAVGNTRIQERILIFHIRHGV